MTVLRSTQQVVQVAEQFDAKLRSTLQYAQVLYTESDPAIDENANNTLTFAQSATTENIITREVVSTLTFVGEALAAWIDRLGNTIPFAQTVSVEKVLSPATANLIIFAQIAEVDYLRTKELSDNLTFVQTVHCAKVLTTQVASNTLTFSQSVSDFRATASTLSFSQSVSWAWGGQEKYLESDLTFSQLVAVDIVLSASASNTLTFSQSASQGYVAEGATDITQELTFSQFAVGTVLATERFVLLQAPYPQVAASVILPSAEFNDKENALGDMKIKRAMDGTRRTYVYRSNDRRLAYTFDMTREKGLELQDFLETYNAEHLRLQNWKGEIWDVQLLTNPLEFTQNRRHDPNGANCAINLEFEGVKLSG